MQQLNVHDISLDARRRYYLIANASVGAWIITGIAVAVLRYLGRDLSWWLSVHTITIGVIVLAILIYSHHFAEALTRTASQSYSGRFIRLGIVQLCLVGLIASNTGIDWSTTTTISAVGIIGVLLSHLVVLVRKLRGSLAGSFVVTVNYYLAASVHLVIAIVMVIIASYSTEDYGQFIIIHSRLAVWGFAVLTVLGTMVTLLPTVAHQQINTVARNRMGRALVVYSAGLYFALAAMWLEYAWAAAVGTAAVIVAVILIIQPTLAGVITARRLSVAACGIIGGTLWLVGLLALDVYSFAINHDGRDLMLVILLPLVIGGFVPLISSVLSHLLPVLIGGGPLVPQTQTAIQHTGFARLTLFNLGGIFALFDQDLYALLLAVPASVWTVTVIGWHAMKQRNNVIKGQQL